MEGTHDVLAGYLAAMPQVGAQVGTEGIEHPDLARFGPEQHKVLVEVLEGLHSAYVEVGGEADDEPASWPVLGEGIAALRGGLGHGALLS